MERSLPGVGGVEPLELVDFVELFRNVSKLEDELVFLQIESESQYCGTLCQGYHQVVLQVEYIHSGSRSSRGCSY